MRERAEALFAAGFFPLALGLGLWASLALMRGGVDPALAFVGPMLACYAAVAACERVVPFRREWSRGRGDVHVDLGHLLVSGVIGLEALRPFVLAAAVAGAGWLSRALGSPLWPDAWPLLAQLAFALVLGEFFMYWIHRLTHQVDWLWRFHATHHSAPRLYWLNATRFHPVDLFLSGYSWYVPLVLLGAGEAVIALYTFVTAVHGIFQHANLPIRIGPLNWIFSMAELHRWHHQRPAAEANRNFGQNLIVWDVVFGTRYLPRDREPSGDVGLDGLAAFPMTYLAQLASPLRWRRIQRESGLG